MTEVRRDKAPKDGAGPRGFPDCYYTSRALESTFRYVRFVRKLRQEEEEMRKGNENNLKVEKDHATNDFFIRCDRRSRINKVARKVELCLQSYMDDLNEKRKRLKDLLCTEEAENIRKFVIQAQSGNEMLWQQKQERLQYLLEKRRKEHEEKYKDPPLEKCVHAHPCIVALRAKEAQQIQLYQMKEKQARKMAEAEFDNMWHEVAMSESEALAARMEVDAIERKRRDMDCKQHSDNMMIIKQQQREAERQRLIEETKWLKSIWESDNKKEEEAAQQRRDKIKENNREINEMLQQNREANEKKKEEDRVIQETWDSLAGQGLAAIKAEAALRRRKEQDLDTCNRKLIELRDRIAAMDTEFDKMYEDEAARRQEALDIKRCEYKTWSNKVNRDVRKDMIQQIADRKKHREELQKQLAEQDEYHRQLREQLQQLVQNKERSDAEIRKNHQRNLLDQIEYNKILKERALEEERDQVRKYHLATEQYQNEIGKMVCRPFFSDELHPFMKQMAKGLKMREKCPCSKPDYCAE